MLIFIYDNNIVIERREEYRLRVFENSVMRKTFEPVRDGVTGEWGRLNNDKYYDCTPDQNTFG